MMTMSNNMRSVILGLRYRRSTSAPLHDCEDSCVDFPPAPLVFLKEGNNNRNNSGGGAGSFETKKQQFVKTKNVTHNGSIPRLLFRILNPSLPITTTSLLLTILSLLYIFTNIHHYGAVSQYYHGDITTDLRRNLNNDPTLLNLLLSITPKPRSVMIQSEQESFTNVTKINLYQYNHLITEEESQQQHPKNDTRSMLRNRRTLTPPLNSNSKTNDDITDECIPIDDWQKKSYPSCNTFHEVDSTNIIPQKSESWIHMINSGMNRDVWEMKSSNDRLVMKTIRMERSFNKEKIELQRIDAIISEQLTMSPYIADIYGYCGYSAIYDFAEEGSLEDHYQNLDYDGERLRVAVDVTHGLADLHNLGSKGFSLIIHADIAVRQFVKLKGVFKLTDFNTAKLIFWNKTRGEYCPNYIGKAGDKNRAPEETISDKNPVNEKIDIYSLGNIYFKLLTNNRKYDDISTREAHKLMLQGDDPPFPREVIESVDPVVVALREATEMCLQRYPEKRPTANQLFEFLNGRLIEFETEKKKMSSSNDLSKIVS